MSEHKLEESQTFRKHRYCGEHAALLYPKPEDREKYVDIPIVTVIKTVILILDQNVRDNMYPTEGSMIQCDNTSLLRLSSIEHVHEQFNIRYTGYMSHLSIDTHKLVPYTCFINLKKTIEFALESKVIYGHHDATLDATVRASLDSIGNLESLDSIVSKLKELEGSLLQYE
jgi:hypothetical protein